MEFTTGQILEGKVKTITNFGAFISLPEGRSGLVHISEIAYSYVNEVRDFLTEGQDVKAPVRRDPLPGMGEVLPPSDDRAFEDKLKAFMSESDSKMAGIRQYEHRTKSRRR